MLKRMFHQRKKCFKFGKNAEKGPPRLFLWHIGMILFSYSYNVAISSAVRPVYLAISSADIPSAFILRAVFMTPFISPFSKPSIYCPSITAMVSR